MKLNRIQILEASSEKSPVPIESVLTLNSIFSAPSPSIADGLHPLSETALQPGKMVDVGMGQEKRSHIVVHV